MRFSLLSVLKRFVLSLAVLALVMGVPSMGRAATPEELAWSWSVAVGNPPAQPGTQPGTQPVAVSYTNGDFVQVCANGKCTLVRAAKNSEPKNSEPKNFEPTSYTDSNPTTVQGFASGAGFRPFQRFREWQQDRPKLLGGGRRGRLLGGGCSSCGG